MKKIITIPPHLMPGAQPCCVWWRYRKTSSKESEKKTEGFETIEAINPIIDETGILAEPPKNYSIFFPGGLTFGDPYQNIEEALNMKNIQAITS